MADSPLESVFATFLPEWRRSTWREEGLPEGISSVGYYAADDGVAIEVALVAHVGRTSLDALRRAWKLRHGNRKVGLVLLAASPESDDLRVVGIHDGARSGLISRSTAERIIEEALEQSTTRAAEEVLDRLFVDPDDDLPLGLRNGGLFASHSLVTTAPASSQFRTPVGVRSHRDLDLLESLGWQVFSHGEDRLLRDGDHTRAVAVVLEGNEAFERPSLNYGLGTSPAENALQAARSRELPWVIAVQGSVVRLYSANADRGVARNGGAPYVELDVALLSDRDIGFATLLLTPAALSPDGDVESLLEDSRDHAVELGERLRDRVYTDAVPDLAETVARRSGDLSEAGLAQAYHVTLTVLFRLLFVAYAEDRGLLPYRTNAVYTRRSVKGRARELAERGDRAFDTTATDMWHDLIDIWSAVESGNSDWGVPPYGGSLFRASSETGMAIAGLELTNAEIGPVLAAMLVDVTESGVGPVDFRSLSVREFGTIYEGLLESSLSVAPADLTIRDTTKVKNAYLPAQPGDVVLVPAGGVYFHNASGARKATGSYFTKEFAVEHLLTTALDPTVGEHLERIKALLNENRESDAADSFFDFRVADIAMGSGHFLVAAVDHLARDLEQFYLEHPIPGVKAELERLRSSALTQLKSVGVDVDGATAPQIRTSDLIRRQVAKRCIYGVDINEIAVDLARLAIWIHTFVPGLPMSDLSHGLIHGNSLTGISSLDEVLEIIEPSKSDASAQWRTDSLFRQPLVDGLRAAEEPLGRAARLAEASVGESEEARALRDEAEELLAPVRAVMDAALASRLGRTFLLDATVQGWDAVVAKGRSTTVRDALQGLYPIHFPVAFPEVFGGPRDGFDVIVGNPPWEEVTVEEDKFWGMHDPQLRSLESKKRSARMRELADLRPDLNSEYRDRVAQAKALRSLLLKGQFPGMEKGDPDLYKAFLWQFWRLLSPRGRLGVVLPRSAFAALGPSDWRNAALRQSRSDVIFAINEGEWIFADVNVGWSVALLTLVRSGPPALFVGGPYRSASSFARHSMADLLMIDLGRLSQVDPNLCVPAIDGPNGIRLFATLIESKALGATRDDFIVRPVRELDVSLDGRDRFFTNDSNDHPVFNHLNIGRFTFEPEIGVFNYVELSPVREELLRRRIATYRRSDSPMRGMPANVAHDSCTLPLLHPRIAIRDVVHASNPYKVWAALVPSKTVLTNKAPWLFFLDAPIEVQAYLLGILNSAICDWYGHLRVVLNLNFFILNTIPVPIYHASDSRCVRVAELAGSLALTSQGDFGEWRRFDGPVLSDAERVARIAELDALVSLLYGVPDDLLDEVFNTPARSSLSEVKAWRAKWSAA